MNDIFLIIKFIILLKNILYFIYKMQASLYKYTKNEEHKKYTLNDFNIIKEVSDQIKWKNPKFPYMLRFNFDTICKPDEYESAPPSSKNVGELAIQFFHKLAETNLNIITPNYVTNFNICKTPVH